MPLTLSEGLSLYLTVCVRTIAIRERETDDDDDGIDEITAPRLFHELVNNTVNALKLSVNTEHSLSSSLLLLTSLIFFLFSLSLFPFILIYIYFMQCHGDDHDERERQREREALPFIHSLNSQVEPLYIFTLHCSTC